MYTRNAANNASGLASLPVNNHGSPVIDMLGLYAIFGISNSECLSMMEFPASKRRKLPTYPDSRTKQLPRNAPCPCGSGKKAKKCCKRIRNDK